MFRKYEEIIKILFSFLFHMIFLVIGFYHEKISYNETLLSKDKINNTKF